MSIVKQTTFSNPLSCFISNGYGAWKVGEFSEIYENFIGKGYSKVLQAMSIHATNDMTTFTVKATRGIVASDVYMKPEREIVMVRQRN